MSLAYDVNDFEDKIVSPTCAQENKDEFSETISKLIEDKFSFSPLHIVLERKPKADKGV